jgi:transglutaminase-like putative cysteine protease
MPRGCVIPWPEGDVSDEDWVESRGGLGDVVTMIDHAPYLRPTWFVDSDSPRVREFAARAVGDRTGDIDKAVALYYAIRDGIRYDPYAMSADPQRYRASTVATLPAAYCIQKSTLMAAAARAVDVPSRLGFADVRNHLTSPKLREAMGSDLFVYHGFTELFLGGRWVKATPVFNLSLCERFGVRPLEFDGHHDSIFHPFDAQNRKHMEYVRSHGSFAELPFAEIMEAFRREYPTLRTTFDGGSVRDEMFRPSSGDS